MHNKSQISHISKAFAVMSALIFFFLSLGGSTEGMVLCVGTNGHVAIEYAHLGNGQEIATHDTQSSCCENDHAENRMGNTGCGRCFDIPISMFNTRNCIFKIQHNQIRNPVVSEQVLWNLVGCNRDNNANHTTCFMLPEPCKDSCDMLQSIVLLI